MRHPALLSFAVASLGALALGAGCASTPPRHSLLLQRFAGARADGAYAWLEVESLPGEPERARLLRFDPRAGALAESPLDPALARLALDRAARWRSEPGSSFESLGPLPSSVVPAGFDTTLARSLPLAADGRAALDIGSVVKAELHVDATSGSLLATLRLPAERLERPVFAVPRAGRFWVSGLLAMPGQRRVLLAFGSATASAAGVHRVEALAELDLGRAASELLDTRALEALQRREFPAARTDLERAVQADPSDATAHYNLACVLALTGEQDAALLALGRAVELEPEQLAQQALQDPDLDSLRDRVEFKLMIEPRPD